MTMRIVIWFILLKFNTIQFRGTSYWGAAFDPEKVDRAHDLVMAFNYRNCEIHISERFSIIVH